MPDFTNYTGDKNLGLGGSNIGVAESEPLNVINQTGRDLMMLNHENNIKIFDQKIKDRATMMELIDSGKLPIGDILPQDRDKIKPYQDAVEKALIDLKKGGLNNTEAYAKYGTAVKDLKDSITHAQGRVAGRKLLETEMATQVLKYKQELYANHIKKEDDKSFLDGKYDPFQQSLDFDMGKLMTPILTGALSSAATAPTATTTKTANILTTTRKGTTGKTTTTSTTAPVKGQVPVGDIIYRNGLPYSQTKQYYSFNKMLNNSIESYRDKSGEGTEQQEMHFQNMQSAPPEIFEPYAKHIVDRVNDYNRERGLKQQRDADYIDSKQVAKELGIDETTGKRIRNTISMPTPKFNALAALASVDGSYTPVTETFLKDQATIQSREKIAKGQLGLGYARLAEKQRKDFPPEERPKYEKYWSDNAISVFDKNNTLLEDKSALLNLSGDGSIFYTNKTGVIPFDKTRNIYTVDAKGQPKILIPFGAEKIYDVVDAKGEPVPKKSKVIGFTGGVGYKTQFYEKSTGQELSADEIRDGFESAKRKNKGLTEEEYLYNLNQGGITYRAIGQDGLSANIDDNANALRVLDNKYGKKGDREPIEPDSQELFTQESTPDN